MSTECPEISLMDNGEATVLFVRPWNAGTDFHICIHLVMFY